MSSPSLGAFPTIASAPIFVVSSDVQIAGSLKLDKIAFQELGGINSEIVIEQYISSDPVMGINHTKQFGLIRPPTVTLKRGLDSDLTLWQWHQMAIAGKPEARADWVSLEVYASVGDFKNGKVLMTYTLHNAWCAKINISSAKAGEGFLAEDVVIACDRITEGDGN